MMLNIFATRHPGLPIGLLLIAAIITGAISFISMPIHSFQVMMVLFFAAMVSSIVGFAFSAIAGAMLSFFIASPLEAVQIMLCCSIAIQSYSVMRLWKHIQWNQLAPFLWGGIVTLVPFCYLSRRLSQQDFILFIGLFLVSFGFYTLLKRPIQINTSKRYQFLFDALAGALGGITAPMAAMPGPPVTIWCNMKGMDKTAQRALFQPYILIMQMATLMLFSLTGVSKGVSTTNLLYALAALVGCHLGIKLFERISNQCFNRMIYILLIISGVTMLVNLA